MVQVNDILVQTDLIDEMRFFKLEYDCKAKLLYKLITYTRKKRTLYLITIL